MKTILSLLLIISFNLAIAQTTAIPDANFERALINLGLDIGVPDGSVPTANIDTVTVLNVSGKIINDLKGIEDFTALTNLNCSDNKLTSLNVSQFKGLTLLRCWNNLISNLDVTRNSALTKLYCSNNKLSSLNVTQNFDLITLSCHTNQLTSLDVSKNKSLEKLYCYYNQLTSLDLTKNPDLKDIVSHHNMLPKSDSDINSTLSFDFPVDYIGLPIDLKETKILYVNIRDSEGVSGYAKHVNGSFRRKMKKYPYQYKIADNLTDIDDCKYRVFIYKEDILLPTYSASRGYFESTNYVYYLYLENIKTGERYKLNQELKPINFTFKDLVNKASGIIE